MGPLPQAVYGQKTTSDIALLALLVGALNCKPRVPVTALKVLLRRTEGIGLDSLPKAEAQIRSSII